MITCHIPKARFAKLNLSRLVASNHAATSTGPISSIRIRPRLNSHYVWALVTN